MKAFNFNKLTTVSRGKSATEKRVAIADNGQMRFNSLASEFLAKSVSNPDEVVVYFLLDNDNNLLIDTKPYTKKEFPELEENYTPEYGKKLSFNAEQAKEGQHSYYVSLASLLTDAGYDYKTSGAQSFAMVTGAKNPNSRLQFKLPQGALERRQITPRKKREKPADQPVIEQQTEPELVEA